MSQRKHGVGLCLMLASLWGCDAEDDQLSGVSEVEVELEQLRSHAPPVSASGTAINARGAFTCDFGIDFTQVTEPLGATIERDRILSQRFVREATWPNDPGMLQKHIPILQTSPTSAFAGGRYLFEGRLQAALYELWITQLYTYPGTTQFLERPEFSDPECRDWSVLLAWRFDPLAEHTALRTERFDTGLTKLSDELALAHNLIAAGPELVAEAEARGYAEVQLLHSLVDHKVSLVYFASSVTPPDPQLPDVGALDSIASDAPLGDELMAEHGLTRVFDRPSLVLTMWLPYGEGDSGEASIWPNSPPLPEPFCGDGVCAPSRGESFVECPADCTASCGDAVCQPDEDLTLCPSDCELPM